MADEAKVMNQRALWDQGHNQCWKHQLILDSRKQLSICLTLSAFYAYGNQLPQNPCAFIAKHWSPERTGLLSCKKHEVATRKLKWVESSRLTSESWCQFTCQITVSMCAPAAHGCPGASTETARWGAPVCLPSDLVFSHSLEATPANTTGTYIMA